MLKKTKTVKNMEKVLNNRSIKHIVSDAFANDTVIPDPLWISNYILKKVKDGSIILIHMPERGVREWNLEAMELTLQGLNKMDLKIVTLSELFDML